MNTKQIKTLIENCGLPDSCENIKLKDTHISWVILTDNYAFKIKRPVTFSFLDFSTLEERKYYCYEELELNRRLEPDIYLDVIPLTQKMLDPDISTDEDEIIDYAVKMKRMDEQKEMIAKLEKDQVNDQHIDKLAKKIAGFHKQARVIKNAFNTSGFQEKYADIESEFPFIVENFGKEKKEMIQECIKKSFTFLNKNRSVFNERVISGFRKDIHGDLNASNIFLYEEPVIFDCIEFDKEYRQIDLMNEIAFLSVDLEFYGKQDLSERFYEKYCEFYGLKNESNQEKLYTYFKSYRANVRAKISLINTEKKKEYNRKDLEEAEKYLDIMKKYSDKL